MTRSEILQIAKPILFNTEMVRANLDGKKTVTRRVIKPQPNELYFSDNVSLPVEKVYCDQGWYGRELKLPYQPGDYLYVREAWTHPSEAEIAAGAEPGMFLYKADRVQPAAWGKWHPSIHMPKEAARIFLLVTDVRPERLKDMTADSAMSEGFADWNDAARVWDSTIPPKDRNKYGWNANPWVWVIEFERVEVNGHVSN